MDTKEFKRFEKGLTKHHITVEEFQTKYKVLKYDVEKECEEIPEQQEYCICGMKIIHNRYVRNIEEIDTSKRILVVGSCCIKKFIPEENRNKICGNCKRAHKNREVNLCKKCEYTYCYLCYAFIHNSYEDKHKMCKECIEKRMGKLEVKLREKYRGLNIKIVNNKYYLTNNKKEIILNVKKYKIVKKYNSFKKSMDEYINNLDLTTLTHIKIIDNILQSKFEKNNSIYQPLGDSFKIKNNKHNDGEATINFNYIWNITINGKNKYGIFPEIK